MALMGWQIEAKTQLQAEVFVNFTQTGEKTTGRQTHTGDILFIFKLKI